MDRLREKVYALSDFLDKAALIIACGSIAVMTVVVVVQVIVRYFFKSSLIWGEELPRYLMICATFIGASSVVKRGELIEITLFRNLLPAAVQRIFRLVATVCSMIFLLFVIYYGTKHALSPMIVSQLSPALRIPMSVPYAVVPIGAALMLIQFVRVLLQAGAPAGESGKRADSQEGEIA